MAKKQRYIRSGVIKRASYPIRLKYYYQLNKKFPNAKNYIEPNGYFHVYGNIRANSSSSQYKIEFISKGQMIYVRVHDFSFEKVCLRKIPHIFIKESSNEYRYITLCLFRNTSNQKQFVFGDNLEKTIIAWTKEWLYFYELFLITGKWYGNGEHSA